MGIAVGIDLSLTDTGIVVVHDSMYEASVARVGRTGLTMQPVRDQIKLLNGMVLEIMDKILVIGGHLSAVVIEGLDMSNSYGGQPERCKLWYDLIESLSGFAKVGVAASGTVKVFAAGDGRATKGAVIDAVTRQWPFIKHGGNDNLADAGAMAMLALAWDGMDLSLSKKQQDAVSRVRSIQSPPPARKSKR